MTVEGPGHAGAPGPVPVGDGRSASRFHPLQYGLESAEWL